MKKYSFLIYHQQYQQFLETLKEVGVLHVKEIQEGIPENDALREKMQFASRIQNAIRWVESYQKVNKVSNLNEPTTDVDGLQWLTEIEKLQSEKELISVKKNQIEREIDRMSVFGNYEYHTIQKLSQNGIFIHLFVCQISRYKLEWEKEYEVLEIAKDEGLQYFAILSNTDSIPVIDAEPVRLNELNVSQLNGLHNELLQQLSHIDSQFSRIASPALAGLRNLHEKTENSIDWIKVVLNTSNKADDKVKLLEGYCPITLEEKLKNVLQMEAVYYESADPDIHDEIPVKLKNNAFTKLFEPITELFSLPNYRELDPTPFLAPFFMLFFGLCLGDGGYGLIIWAAATWMKRGAKVNMRPLLTLGQYLGLMTVAVGLLTGSFFGVALDQVEWKWLADVKHLFLTESNYAEKIGGFNPMMLLAVVVGIVQILFGMLIKVLKVNKQHGFRYAVGHLAWVFFILTAMAYLGLPALGVTLQGWWMYILYALLGSSLLVIVFYNSPGKGLFSNVGSALWNTYNMATGLLGDTLSYVRLFALGLTGSILGGVFNTLAFDLTSGIDPLARWFFVLLILLIGHSINFALCLIGAFVHPIRLTFVEFYKNAGFEGGGKAYRPFGAQKK